MEDNHRKNSIDPSNLALCPICITTIKMFYRFLLNLTGNMQIIYILFLLRLLKIIHLAKLTPDLIDLILTFFFDVLLDFHFVFGFGTLCLLKLKLL